MPMQSPWPDQNLPLAERHEQLSRTTQALWQLLKTKLDLRDDELQQALSQLEPSPPESAQRLLNCHICRNPVRSTARSCLYCGTAPDANAATSRVTNMSGAWQTHR